MKSGCILFRFKYSAGNVKVDNVKENAVHNRNNTIHDQNGLTTIHTFIFLNALPKAR